MAKYKFRFPIENIIAPSRATFEIVCQKWKHFVSFVSFSESY